MNELSRDHAEPVVSITLVVDCIGGYRVTEDLIERVSKEDWSPEVDGGDTRSEDALAARGYY